MCPCGSEFTLRFPQRLVPRSAPPASSSTSSALSARSQEVNLVNHAVNPVVVTEIAANLASNPDFNGTIWECQQWCLQRSRILLSACGYLSAVCNGRGLHTPWLPNRQRHKRREPTLLLRKHRQWRTNLQMPSQQLPQVMLGCVRGTHPDHKKRAPTDLFAFEEHPGVISTTACPNIDPQGKRKRYRLLVQGSPMMGFRHTGRCSHRSPDFLGSQG